MEKNVLLDDDCVASPQRGGRAAETQSRWPSLLSLFNATVKPGHLHRPASSRGLSTSRRFQSELNVPAAADRKQYGGQTTMTSPRVGVGRPSSALTRPTFVAVDIPLQDNTRESRHAVEKGKENL